MSAGASECAMTVFHSCALHYTINFTVFGWVNIHLIINTGLMCLMCGHHHCGKLYSIVLYMTISYMLYVRQYIPWIHFMFKKALFIHDILALRTIYLS